MVLQRSCQLLVVAKIAPFSPNCKMSYRQGEIQTLSHRKSDAIYACYGSWLKEEGFLSYPVER